MPNYKNADVSEERKPVARRVATRMRVRALTELQEELVENILLGTSIAELSDRGGMTHQGVSHSLRQPHVAAAVMEGIRTRIKTVGACVGWNILSEIAKDTGAPAGVRRQAAADLLNFAGFSAALGDRLNRSELTESIDLSVLSAQDLKVGIANLEAEIQARGVAPPLIEAQPLKIRQSRSAKPLRKKGASRPG